MAQLVVKNKDGRISLNTKPSLLITLDLGVGEESLNFFFVMNCLHNYEISPVNCPDPADDVHCCHPLEDSDENLRFAPMAFTEKPCHYGAESRQHTIDNCCQVGPNSTKPWYVAYKPPQFAVSLRCQQTHPLYVIGRVFYYVLTRNLGSSRSCRSHSFLKFNINKLAVS